MAWYAPWRREREAIIASAHAVDSQVRAEYALRKHLDWQDRAFVYLNKVGEAAYSAEFYSRILSKLELGVGHLEWDEAEGGYRIEPVTDQKFRDVFDEIQDPEGGRQMMLANYGRLMFSTGEAFFVGTRQDKAGEYQWEVLSHKEIRVTGDNEFQRLVMPGVKPEELKAVPDNAWEIVPKSTKVIRLWRADPEFSWCATSPMRPVLDILEELLLLDQAIHARATNRAAGPGILFIPNSIAAAIPDVEPKTPEERQMTPIVKQLTRAMTTPIGEPGSASAVVPLVVTGPDDAGQKIQHVSFYDNASEWPEAVLREKALTRLAQVSDFPMEYLVGLQDSNHWSAWQVDDQTWAQHGQPLAEMMVRDWSAALFRPLLVARGACSAEDAVEYVVTYDESEVVTRPDKSASTVTLYDRGIANAAAALRESGLDEDDAMDDDEYAKWVGIQLKDANLALGSGEPTPPPPPPMFPPPHPNGEQPQGEEPGDKPSEQPADAPPEKESATARILGAAELAVIVCREKAGSRLASRAQACPDCLARIKGVPKSQIAPVLTETTLPFDVPKPELLVAGGGECFLQQLLAWGYPLTFASYAAGAVEEHAALTLFDVTPVTVPGKLVSYAEAGGITH